MDTSRVQKALEERKAILDFINHELPKYQTSPRDRNFVMPSRLLCSDAA
jgi:hypothetical protein